MYGQLLEAGVRIFEYKPGMTHVKTLIVDDLWSVIGTTNFDNRSFEHNDEVNVAIRDAAVARAPDSTTSRPTSRTATRSRSSDWRRRPLWEKLVGTVAWILERQQ